MKGLLIWIVLVLLVFGAWQGMQMGSKAGIQQITYEEFMQAVENGNVSSVTWSDDGTVSGYFAKPVNGNTKFRTTILPPRYQDAESLRKLIKEKNPGARLEIQVQRPDPWISALVMWGPMLLIFVFFMFMMRGMQGGANKALSFGKARAKLVQNQKKVTFANVAGVEEAKEDVQEVVEFLRDPRKFQKLGGRIPKGVLLVGPPGCGKTLLARAVAGEANVPFFSISGSDFVEMFVGVGASRVRDLFEQAKKNAPCILFIDELDAVGRHRGTGLGGGHDEREQTLNQLLVEMDGFEQNGGVILIAATNRPDVLDPALLRPGRFDRQVVVSRPDLKGRLAILNVHAKGKPLGTSVALEDLARGTTGFSGADLESLLNEAALRAARKGKDIIEREDVEDAKDKVTLGSERKSVVLTAAEKRITAFHEAGHTLVALLTKGADPVHKVTIVPRGMALGVTHQMPLEDQHGHSKTYLEGKIAICLGGRVAEELIVGDITTGAASDIETATEIARKMVCEWGMSDLGPIKFGSQTHDLFLGKKFAQGEKEYSEDTGRAIDGAIKGMVDKGYTKARRLLGDNRHKLEQIANALLERETLHREDLEQLMKES